MPFARQPLTRRELLGSRPNHWAGSKCWAKPPIADPEPFSLSGLVDKCWGWLLDGIAAGCERRSTEHPEPEPDRGGQLELPPRIRDTLRRLAAAAVELAVVPIEESARHWRSLVDREAHLVERETALAFEVEVEPGKSARAIFEPLTRFRPTRLFLDPQDPYTKSLLVIRDIKVGKNSQVASLSRLSCDLIGSFGCIAGGVPISCEEASPHTVITIEVESSSEQVQTFSGLLLGVTRTPW